MSNRHASDTALKFVHIKWKKNRNGYTYKSVGDLSLNELEG